MVFKCLGDDFVKDISKGYGSIVFYGLGVVIFGDKGYGCGVYLRGKGTIFKPRSSCRKKKKIGPNRFQFFLKKVRLRSFGPWDLLESI